MLELFRRAALIAATLSTGLIAGLLYSYACSVMPGLSRADNRTFVDVMQRVNAAILNGWFLISFLGALVFTAVAAVLHFGAGGRSLLPWIVAALVLYGAAFLVTIGINVCQWPVRSPRWRPFGGELSGHATNTVGDTRRSVSLQLVSAGSRGRRRGLRAPSRGAPRQAAARAVPRPASAGGRAATHRRRSTLWSRRNITDCATGRQWGA
jgi:uncharacterized membrane protein